MIIDGGCHCGQFSYRAEVDPDTVIICHSTDCQTLSGSAYRTVVPALEGSFEVLRVGAWTHPGRERNLASRHRENAQIIRPDS